MLVISATVCLSWVICFASNRTTSFIQTNCACHQLYMYYELCLFDVVKHWKCWYSVLLFSHLATNYLFQLIIKKPKPNNSFCDWKVGKVDLVLLRSALNSWKLEVEFNQYVYKLIIIGLKGAICIELSLVNVYAAAH